MPKKICQARLLIVDNLAEHRERLRGFIEESELLRGRLQIPIDTCTNADETIERLESYDYDIVLSDVFMPPAGGSGDGSAEEGGIKLFDWLKKKREDPEVGAVYRYIQLRWISILSDCTEFLHKYRNPENISWFNYIDKYESERKQRYWLESEIDECIRMIASLGFEEPDYNFIAESSVMQEVLKNIRKIAQLDSTILITGETGTGKEVVARKIHDESHRNQNPFVPVNCPALPGMLLESELFGHERGAFTGAFTRKRGRFEIANGGTLFLDEIGEMDISLQPKLLRAIENKEIWRVGSTKPTPVDIRIVAATNQNLEEAIEAGSFREDLYYRLSAFPIEIPSLQERKEDILPLAQHFIRDLAQENNRKITAVSEEFRNCLLSYHWPGNVRELKNVIERAIILSESEVLTEDLLPSHILGEESSTLTSTSLDATGQRYLQALQNNAWNQSRAARELGIKRQAVHGWLKKHPKLHALAKRREDESERKRVSAQPVSTVKSTVDKDFD